VHSALNPARRAPHLASLLLPLYGVLQGDAEHEAHAEADAFWLFEALVGELGELEDDDAGATRWMARFGERVAWADPELAADLVSRCVVAVYTRMKSGADSPVPAAHEGPFARAAALLLVRRAPPSFCVARAD
jgi:hypothetical protein